MIFHPKPGQRVRLHYGPTLRPFMPYHGSAGTVEAVGRGPGPINVAVRLDDGLELVVVPRGNLRRNP